MRLFVLNCLLLASVAYASPNGRHKRDLAFLKNLISSAFFGQNQINSQPQPIIKEEVGYKLFRIPEYEDVMIRVSPKKAAVQKFVYPPEEKVNLNAFGAVVGTKSRDDTLVAVNEVDNLLSSGILYGGHNNVMKETIVPMFPAINSGNYVINENIRSAPIPIFSKVVENRPVFEEVIETRPRPIDAKIIENRSRPIVAEFIENRPRPIVAEFTENLPRPIVAEFIENRPRTILTEFIENRPRPIVAEFIENRSRPIVAEFMENRPRPIVTELIENQPRPIVTEFIENRPKPIATDEIEFRPFFEEVIETRPNPVLTEVIEKRPVFEEVIANRPVFEEIIENRPVFEEVIETRPYPVLTEVIENRPVFEEVIENRSVFEEVIENRPVFEEIIANRPVFEEVIENRPVFEEVIETRPYPVLTEVIENRPVFEEVIENRPVFEEVIEPRPGFEEVIENIPVFEEVVENRPVFEEVIETRPNPVLTEVVKEKVELKVPYEQTYSYKQMKDNKPMMTYTAHTIPGVDILENIKRKTELPMCIKKRVDEVIVLGNNPNRLALEQEAFQYRNPPVIDVSYPEAREKANSYKQNSLRGEVLTEGFDSLSGYELDQHKFRPSPEDRPVRYNVRLTKTKSINPRPIHLHSHKSLHLEADITSTKEKTQSPSTRPTPKVKAFTNVGKKINIDKALKPVPLQYIANISNKVENSAASNKMTQMKAVTIVNSKDNVSNAKIPSSVYRLQANPNTGKTLKENSVLRTNVKSVTKPSDIAPVAATKNNAQVRNVVYINKVTAKPKTVTKPVKVALKNAPKISSLRDYIKTSSVNKQTVAQEAKSYTFQQRNADGSSLNVNGNKNGVSVNVKNNNRSRGDIPDQ